MGDQRIIDELREQVKRLTERVAVLEPLEAENARLRKENAELQAKLDEARRAGKRQAAPFRKKPPKGEPKTPGRKRGKDHGGAARAPVPTAEEVTETVDAPLPETCPGCGDPTDSATLETPDEQFQLELPAQPIVRRIRVARGVCQGCGKRLRGRHAEQTSQATGAAKVQLGPRAQATASWLKQTLGLSFGKISSLYKQAFGLSAHRSTLCRAMLRAADRCEDEHQRIRAEFKKTQDIATADETGWAVAGLFAWLHVLVGESVTVYEVRRDRGIGFLADLLDFDWAGTLIHDAWRVYDQLVLALHQACTSHLLHRLSREQEALGDGPEAQFAKDIEAVIRRGLAVRDRRDAGELSQADVEQIVHQTLWPQIDALLKPPQHEPRNVTLRKYLLRLRDHLFTYLLDPDVPATNHQAERAIRPAVVNRKSCAGNRTHHGAKALSTLITVMQTWQQNGLQPIHQLAAILRGETSDLVLPSER